MTRARETTEHDVVVVGAGPVGLVAACILGMHGVRTLVVEKNADMYAYPRAVGIDDETMRTLQYVGVMREQAPHMMLAPTIEYLSPTGYVKHQPSAEAREHGYPLLATFLQPVLEAGLRDRARALPDVHLVTGVELVDYEERDGIVAHLAAEGGASSAVRAQFLLGCDGARSTVRRRAGIALEGETQPEKWLVIDVEDSDALRAAIARARLSRHDTPLVTISLPRDLRRFECRLPADFARATAVDDASIRRMLRPFVGDARVEVIRKSVYERYFRRAARLQAGRAFLLGDAAHLVPPYGGQGLCSGVRDAQNLAWKIARVVKGALGPAALRSYGVEREEHMAKTIAFVKRLARLIEGDDGAPAAPLTADERGRAKPAPAYARGFFDEARFGGALFPQPRVGHGDRVAPLDDLLGHGFAVLRRDDCGVDARAFRAFLGADAAVLDVHDPARGAAPGDAVIDLDGTLRRYLAERRATFVVLRPDRFVFAAAADADASRVRDVYASWSRGAGSGKDGTR